MPGWMQEKWYTGRYHPDQFKFYIMNPWWRKELQNEPAAARLTEDAQTLFPSAPNLRPWWDFYLQSRRRCLRRIWTEPAITSCSSTTINLPLPLPPFTHNGDGVNCRPWPAAFTLWNSLTPPPQSLSVTFCFFFVFFVYAISMTCFQIWECWSNIWFGATASQTWGGDSSPE